MIRFFKAGFVGVAAITLTVTATASGPKWQEMGDAGSDPNGAQITMGMGSLGFINGNMGALLLAGIDFEDMFLINIVDPMNFRATTDPMDPELAMAFANFDTQLWLFQPTADPPDAFALGFLGNDDHPDLPGSNLSLLIPVPTDGSPPLVAPGLYYIAISRFNNDPFSDPGEQLIFLQATPQEISGPDGPGGMMPISGWTGDKGMFDGDYRIALQGVEFAEIPAPGALSLLVLGGLTMKRRPRR